MTALRAYEERMPCNYRLLKDLQDRLDGTICRYDGKAVYITVESQAAIKLLDPVERRKLIKVVPPDDPLLDISANECGYFNYKPDPRYAERSGRSPAENTVFYMSRNTSKKYKQGLYYSYITSLHIDGRLNHEYSNDGLVFSQGMIDQIEGVYPTPKTVLEIFEKEYQGKTAEYAVSPDVALRKESVGVIFVYYRMTQMGWIAPGTTNIVVTDHELKWVVERHMTRLTWK